MASGVTRHTNVWTLDRQTDSKQSKNKEIMVIGNGILTVGRAIVAICGVYERFATVYVLQ